MSSTPAQRHAAAAARTANLIEEIEYLATYNLGEANITQTLGLKRQSIERRLHRAGRADLLPRLYPTIAETNEARAHATYYRRIANNDQDRPAA
jgi:hypothetical protein